MTRREKWFWIFVGVAMLIGFLAMIPFNGELCEKPVQAGYKECATHNLPVYLAFKIQIILDALGVAITALATIAIAWFTWTLRRSTDKLWDASDQQLRLSETTAERQLRAYVFVSSAKVTYVTDDGGGIPEAHVFIKNSGQTPAYKVQNVSGFAFDKWPVPANLNLIVTDQEFSAAAKTMTNLASGSCETSIISSKLDKPLPGEDRAALSRGEIVIFVYGEIRYIDAFGKKRWTKYRLMMGGPAGARGGQLVGCEEGNDAN